MSIDIQTHTKTGCLPPAAGWIIPIIGVAVLPLALFREARLAFPARTA